MIENPIPEHHRVQHLFLVVGRNPLPNYVATKLLLQSGGRLYLVYTAGRKGTGSVAQTLKAYLDEFQPKCIDVSIQQPYGIREKATHYLEKIPVGERIGFNYTGGTKVMAIHTRWAIENFCANSSRDQPIFSYLDADTLEIIIEPHDCFSTYHVPVIEAIGLSFDELFTIHNIELKNKPRTEPVMPELAKELANIHTNQVKSWRDGKKILIPDNRQLVKKVTWGKLKKQLLEVDVGPNVTALMTNDLRLDDTQRPDWTTAARLVDLQNGAELARWLAGEWLEHWVLFCLKSLGYKIRAQSLVGLAPNQFEIDVALLRGYQLYAISCGVTTDRGKAKLKFFEIYNRARQIGGDEARAGLVCCVDEPADLEQEIVSEWDARDQVKVFGREHLPELKDHLKNWFDSI